MKIAIMADMEGISGVSYHRQTDATDPPFYAHAQRLLTQDVNACVNGCFIGGAEAVVVYDAHATGHNILIHELDERAELITGKRGGRRFVDLETCAGLILLGYHGRAGTAGAILEHTYSSQHFQNVWLNGRLVGEIEIDASIAAQKGVPTIMVSGDDKTCAQATEFDPRIVTCEVKRGLGRESAWHRSRRDCLRLIHEGAAHAVAGAGEFPPVSVPTPSVLRVELTERLEAPSDLQRPGWRLLDGRTYEFEAPTVESALMRM